MSVEIAHGGAEGVTQGDAIAASLQIDAQGQTFNLIGEENLLHHQAFQVLYHLGQQLEALFDYPQDIEWIFKDQQFYIIQSRDIRIIP